MDNSKTILAKNIRYYMEKNQKTRAALCEALDIKYTTLSDWVNGKTYPRIDKLERLAAYFGIEKSALLEDREHLPPDAIPYTPRQTRPIPIVGVVNCGVPLLAEENIEGYKEKLINNHGISLVADVPYKDKSNVEHIHGTIEIPIKENLQRKLCLISKKDAVFSDNTKKFIKILKDHIAYMLYEN